MRVPLVHSVVFHVQSVHLLLNDYFEQILGWQQAVKLCQPQIVFGRILARLKHLAEGLATYGAEDGQTKAGKEGTHAVVVRRGTIPSEDFTPLSCIPMPCWFWNCFLTPNPTLPHYSASFVVSHTR